MVSIPRTLSLPTREKDCHQDCYRPLPEHLRLGREARLNPEAETWLPTPTREKERALRQIEHFKYYKAPLMGSF
ncbi:MAG: hypothetical protein HYX99_04455 [Chloroflexi bacterium]|nr:hypothetical protein [Chloroflexota bacterium]